jgi:hypothetical protein
VARVRGGDVGGAVSSRAGRVGSRAAGPGAVCPASRDSCELVALGADLDPSIRRFGGPPIGVCRPAEHPPGGSATAGMYRRRVPQSSPQNTRCCGIVPYATPTSSARPHDRVEMPALFVYALWTGCGRPLTERGWGSGRASGRVPSLAAAGGVALERNVRSIVAGPATAGVAPPAPRPHSAFWSATCRRSSRRASLGPRHRSSTCRSASSACTIASSVPIEIGSNLQRSTRDTVCCETPAAAETSACRSPSSRRMVRKAVPNRTRSRRP